MRPVSDQRWCNDTPEMTCANGEYIHLGFVLDCHDRAAIAYRAVVGDFQATNGQWWV